MKKGTVSLVPAAQSDDPEGDKFSAYADSLSPLQLFWQDATVLFKNLGYLVYVLRPLCLAQPVEGTHFSKTRLILEYGYIAIISIIELVLILSLVPLWVILPGSIFLAVVLLYLLVVMGLSAVLWGNIIVNSQSKVDDEYIKKFQREKWIFINGIATSHFMLQCTCDQLSATFKRPVVGVHNRTLGIIGDIVECLMQRSLRFMTWDARVAYASLREALVDDENIDKVVVIAHSQGGIILSLVLDRLYATVPSSHFSKLEVYTFGSAASHFHNPPLAVWQKPIPSQGPGIPKTHSLPADSPTLAAMASSTEPLRRQRSSKRSGNTSNISTDLKMVRPPSQPNGLPVELSPTTNQDLALPNNYIHTVEHYCNAYDIVPRWGVLFGITKNTPLMYSGRVFLHDGGSGHLYDQHYLETMFPLAKVDAIQCEDHKNDPHLFLNHVIHMVGALEKQAIMKAKTFDSQTITTGLGASKYSPQVTRGRRVKDLSRLWKYMDGGVS